MAKSLQEQLLAAGAVDKSRATKLKKAKHKQAKQRARGSVAADEVKISAQLAQAQKTERDRELSRQLQSAQDEKAIKAQIRQLIETNLIDRQGGDISYNFVDQSVVKKLFLSQEQQSALAYGHLAIGRLDDSYALIPVPVANKIVERDPDAILVLNTPTCGARNSDDPYLEYEIPDDLTW